MHLAGNHWIPVMVPSSTSEAIAERLESFAMSRGEHQHQIGWFCDNELPPDEREEISDRLQNVFVVQS